MVWFTSIESFAKVLSERNRALLALIAREEPASLTELAELAGRNKSNLSRTLKFSSPCPVIAGAGKERGGACGKENDPGAEVDAQSSFPIEPARTILRGLAPVSR